MVVDGKSQGLIVAPTVFLLYINDLPNNVICDIAIYADDTTLCSKCDQASYLWQLEFDLRDTLNWDRKWFVDFDAGKNSTVFV